MNECRDAFEKWEIDDWEANISIIPDGENGMGMYTNERVRLDWSCWQVSWQARQKEIDQLVAAIEYTLIKDAKEGYGLHPDSVKQLTEALAKYREARDVYVTGPEDEIHA